FVGLRLAQIPGSARAAHHHAGKTPAPRVRELDHADVDVALLEDAVVGEQDLEVVADLEEGIAERLDVVDELLGQVLVHAADAEIGGVHAGARSALVEHHQLFALLEAPQRRRERAHIHGLGGDVEEMREQPADLAIEYADQLTAARHRDGKKPLCRKAESVLLIHGHDVIETVEIADRLEIGLVLDQLFGAAMEQTDMWIDAFHDLAVKLQHEAQHAMGRRMLRSKIYREITQALFRHGFQLGFAAFSSPGRT